MQGTALALSPSTSFLKPPCRNSISKPSQLSASTSLIQLDNLTCVRRLSWQTLFYTFSSSSSSSSSFPSFNKISASFLFSSGRYDNLKVRAAPESAEEASNQSGMVKTLQLGALFGIWYLLNIYFNIYNKQVYCSLLYLYISVLSFLNCFFLFKMHGVRLSLILA